MKIFLKIAPLLFLILLVYKEVHSCTADQERFVNERYSILEEPNTLFGSYRKAPILKVKSDSGYYTIPLKRYFKKPPLLVGNEIETIDIQENQLQDVAITFSGKDGRETKKFNLKQAQDSLKLEGFYQFERKASLHGTSISKTRAWIDFILGVLLVSLVVWKANQYVQKYMKQTHKYNQFQHLIIRFSMYVIGFALMVFWFLVVFSDVPNFLI